MLIARQQIRQFGPIQPVLQGAKQKFIQSVDMIVDMILKYQYAILLMLIFLSAIAWFIEIALFLKTNS